MKRTYVVTVETTDLAERRIDDEGFIEELSTRVIRSPFFDDVTVTSLHHFSVHVPNDTAPTPQ